MLLFSTISGILQFQNLKKSKILLSKLSVALMVHRIVPENVLQVNFIRLRHEAIPPVVFGSEPQELVRQSFGLEREKRPERYLKSREGQREKLFEKISK